MRFPDQLSKKYNLLGGKKMNRKSMLAIMLIVVLSLLTFMPAMSNASPSVPTASSTSTTLNVPLVAEQSVSHSGSEVSIKPLTLSTQYSHTFYINNDYMVGPFNGGPNTVSVSGWQYTGTGSVPKVTYTLWYDNANGAYEVASYTVYATYPTSNWFPAHSFNVSGYGSSDDYYLEITWNNDPATGAALYVGGDIYQS
jgi:hypothetical protein